MTPEQLLLGAIMLGGDYATAARTVWEKHLDKIEHHHIWKAFEALDKRKVKIDLANVVNELDASDLLDRVGGAAYISSLVGENIKGVYWMPDVASIDEYAHKTRDAWLARRFGGESE